MKRIYLAAGALLMGTSPVAIAAGADSTGKSATETSVVSPAKSAEAAKGEAAVSKAAWWSALDTKLADSGLGVKSAVEGKSLPAKDETADTEMSADKVAALNAEMASNAAVQAKLATAATDDGTGMGGPLDDGQVTTADLTPRAATMNYPPCDPGPGDDRCIQLYEPGVRAQLAAWNAPTGGLADHSATTAMGGPYEPVETDSTELASATIHESMNGDGAVELAHHSGAHEGVGGPVEAQSGYPPCDPGPGDDRCIQLYERGVTGAGN